MKTLAQLKRDIKPGTKILHNGREEAHPVAEYCGNMSNAPYGPLQVVPIPEKLQGTRIVTHVDTTGFYMNATPEDGKRGSFLGFPKASELEYNDNTFIVTCHTSAGHVWLRMHYEIINT